MHSLRATCAIVLIYKKCIYMYVSKLKWNEESISRDSWQSKKNDDDDIRLALSMHAFMLKSKSPKSYQIKQVGGQNWGVFE